MNFTCLCVCFVSYDNCKLYDYSDQLLNPQTVCKYSVIRRGASTELKDSVKEEISQLSYDDVIVICYGMSMIMR